MDKFVWVWTVLNFPFNVYWHDVDLPQQVYLDRSVATSFHSRITKNFLLQLDRDLDLVPGVSLRNVLARLHRKSRQFAEQCHMLRDGAKISSVLASPCARFHVSAAQELPIGFNWTIGLKPGHILNLTIVELGIPTDIACNYGYLRMSEETGDKEIAKTCGRLQNKIFYSSTPNVFLLLTAFRLQRNIATILNFQYQAMDSKMISGIYFIPAQKFEHLIDLHVLHLESFADVFVYFYKTIFDYRFKILRNENNDTKGCSINVYDGPSSRSNRLEGVRNAQGRVEYASTLFCVTIFFTDPSASRNPSCVQVSRVKEQGRMLGYRVQRNKPYTLAFSGAGRTGNFYKAILFIVPSRFTFLHIKMEKFENTGNTEGWCFFSGIVFNVHGHRTHFGPVCGEYGTNVLVKKGLTFGSGNVSMFIYGFAENSGMSFTATVRLESCEGIIDPCSLKSHNSSYFQISISKNKVDASITLHDGTPDSCVHIQQFFHRPQTKVCFVAISGAQRRFGMKADSRILLDHSKIASCPEDCKKAYLLQVCALNNFPIGLTSTADIIESAKPVAEFKFNNSIVSYNTSAYVLCFLVNLNARFGLDLDPAVHLTIARIPDVRCLSSEYKHTHFSEISSACSKSTISTNMNSHVFLFRIEPGINTFHLESANPCPDVYPFLSLGHLYRSERRENYAWFWKLQERYVTWEIPYHPDLSVILFLDYYQHEAENFGDVGVGVAAEQREYCARRGKVTIMHNVNEPLLQYIQHPTSLKTPERPESPDAPEASPKSLKCLGSRCYFAHQAGTVSWEGAARICQQHQQHLVSPHAELQDRALTDMITSAAKELFLSPVIFLNLVKNNRTGMFCWQDGAVYAYQRWFYPRKDTNYVYKIHYKFNYDRVFVKQEIAGHMSFQPQIKPGYDCAAMITVGDRSLYNRRWVTVNCSEEYSDVVVLCESATIDNQMGNTMDRKNNTIKHTIKNTIKIKTFHNDYINEEVYRGLLFAHKTNSTLLVPQLHCPAGYVHTGHSCYRFYKPGTTNDPACAQLSEELIQVFHYNAVSTVRTILSLFLVMTHQSSNSSLHVCQASLRELSYPLKEVFFKCGDGTLIVSYHECDGETDCPDATDERNCSWVCDWSSSNSSDCFTDCLEPDCTCHYLYFQCSSGGCVHLSKICNGFNDCADASDEHLCPVEAQQNPVPDEAFQCNKSSHYIKKSQINDTVPDCPVDGEDEVWPSNTWSYDSNSPKKYDSSHPAEPLALACILPGHHPRVYDHEKVCLLTWDSNQPKGIEAQTCRNGGHLSDCLHHSCPQHYKCPTSYCIPLHAVCDGFADCPDASDESHCHALSCPGVLRCKRDHLCVHPLYVNDGTVDCGMYADDEATADIEPCPTRCECMGFVAVCHGTAEDFLQYSLGLSYLRVLIHHDLTSTADLPKGLFKPLISLRILDLSDSNFRMTAPLIFQPLKTLVKLMLNNVSITELRTNVFQGLENLRVLELQGNAISTLKYGAFNGLSALQFLDLSKLSIQYIDKCAFQGLSALLSLDLSSNAMMELSADMFCGLTSLEELYLEFNFPDSISTSVFRNTRLLKKLRSSIAGLCCYLNIEDCEPKFTDQFASCTSILHHDVTRISVYFLGLLPVAENVFAFGVMRFFSGKKNAKKANGNAKKETGNILRIQLLLSDGIMGVFFLLLSIFNGIYAGDFVMIAQYWRESIHCRVLSFLSMLSLEMTLCTVLVIGIQRFLGTCFPFKAHIFTVKTAWYSMTLAWVLAIILSLLPLIDLFLQNHGLNNALCVSILSFDLVNVYIVVIIFVINTSVTITNIVLHVGVARAVYNMQHNSDFSHMKGRQDCSISVRLVFLIFSNSACWLVLGTVGALRLAGVGFSASAFAATVTTALPISTLLNPVLNVFTTTEFIQGVRQKYRNSPATSKKQPEKPIGKGRMKSEPSAS